MPRGLGHAACPPWGFENSTWRKGCGPASLRGQGWATVPARCSPSREEAGLSRAGCGGVGGDLGAGGSVPSENTRVRGACVQALVAEGGVEVEADSRTVMTGRAQGACPRASRAECASQVRWSVFSSITQTHPSPVAPGNVALGTRPQMPPVSTLWPRMGDVRADSSWHLVRTGLSTLSPGAFAVRLRPSSTPNPDSTESAQVSGEVLVRVSDLWYLYR